MGAEAGRSVGADEISAAFERASAVVQGLATQAPYASIDAVVGRARELLTAMSERERMAVLDSHPRIGAHAAELSALSRREQGADGEAAVERDLAELNDAYERRFGFRFVVFVAGRARAEIVPILRARLRRDRAAELAAGIEELLAIARDRLERRASTAG